MTWLPIETAPKDRRIILYVPKREMTVGKQDLITVGKWDQDRFARKPKPFWTCDTVDVLGIREVRKYQPTHWCPLPAPPGE